MSQGSGPDPRNKYSKNRVPVSQTEFEMKTNIKPAVLIFRSGCRKWSRWRFADSLASSASRCSDKTTKSARVKCRPAQPVFSKQFRRHPWKFRPVAPQEAEKIGCHLDPPVCEHTIETRIVYSRSITKIIFFIRFLSLTTFSCGSQSERENEKRPVRQLYHITLRKTAKTATPSECWLASANDPYLVLKWTMCSSPG